MNSCEVIHKMPERLSDKPRILLVHFPSYDNLNVILRKKKYGVLLPLGIGHIAGTLLREGYDVKVFDFALTESNTDFFNVFDEFKPDILGMTIYNASKAEALALAARVKEKAPNIPIVAGGAFVTWYKASAFAPHDNIDYLVFGEGEATMSELTDAILNNKPVEHIKGLCYKEEDVWVENEPRPFTKHLNDIAPVPLHLFDYKSYIPAAGTFICLPSVPYLSARGCPYKCIFCDRLIFGNTIRLKDPILMVDEIEQMVKDFGVKEINFYDETFTINQKRIFTFCEEIIRRNIKIGFKCGTRVDCVSKELFQIMKKAGCFVVSLGVESADETVLKKMRKGITVEQAIQAFKWAKEAGIKRNAYFMLNMPGDTRETIEKSIRLSRELKPDYVNFEIVRPTPGTKLLEALKAEKNVRINHAVLDNPNVVSISYPICYTQNDLTEEYLISAHKRAWRGFYFHPVNLVKTALRIRTWPQLRSYLNAGYNIFRTLPKSEFHEHQSEI